jgi:GntR family transcriptional regulator
MYKGCLLYHPSMAAQERRWEQIAAELRTEILSGARRPGSQLPTSEQLKAQYDTSRQTVQTAIDRLKDEDLVEARPGVGWFVRKPRSVRLIRSSVDWRDRNARPADGHEDNDWRIGVHIKSEIISAPFEVAKDLRVSPGTELWLRRRTVLNGTQVLHLGLAYLPREFTRGTALENSNGAPSGTYAALGGAGHRIARFSESIAVRPANEVEANSLGLDARRPSAVLCITRIAHGLTCPLEVDYITAPAGRLALVYELPAFG